MSNTMLIPQLSDPVTEVNHDNNYFYHIISSQNLPFMDVSSKYFSLFRHPGPDTIKYVWCFLLDIHRVGKLRELVSFVLWEISHRLRFYQVGNQYVKFTASQFLSLANEENCLDKDAALPSFLAEE